MGLWKQQGHRIRATQTHWSTNDLLPQVQMLDLELQGCVHTVHDLALAQSLFIMHFQIGKFMSLHVICMLCFAILVLLRLTVMFALCLGRDLGLLKNVNSFKL